ncbi:MAG: hypothetical protein ACI88H_002564, partial [Cocleimonas sp.]
TSGALTIFDDAAATGWMPWQENAATWSVVAEAGRGNVIEFGTAGMTVVGVSSRTDLGGSGVTHDASSISTGTVQFDIKMTAAPATTIWKLKLEGLGGVEVDLTCAPALNTWVSCSHPLSELGDLTAINNVMIFPNWADNAGATYLVDDLRLVASGGGTPPVTPIGDLAVNGGFETGNFDGWTLYQTSPVISNDGVSGSFAANLIVSEAQVSVLKYERIAKGAVSTGQVLNISFKMKGTAGAGGVVNPNLLFENNGTITNIVLDSIAVPSAGYTTYSYSPTVTGDVSEGISLEFAVACGAVTGCNANVHIDDVSITIQ